MDDLEKIMVWMPRDLLPKIEKIEKAERRSSRSNTIVALVAEAIAGRDAATKAGR